MNRKFEMLLFICLAFLVGCSSGSGGHDEATPVIPKPVIDGDHAEVNSKCLKRSCGDNFLLHFSVRDLQRLRSSLISFRTNQATVHDRRLSSAIILGGELAKSVSKFDLNDEKTSDCVIWLFSKVIDESGYVVSESGWNFVLAELSDLNKS